MILVDGVSSTMRHSDDKKSFSIAKLLFIKRIILEIREMLEIWKSFIFSKLLNSFYDTGRQFHDCVLQIYTYFVDVNNFNLYSVFILNTLNL